MSGIDARKKAYTIATKIFTILELGIVQEKLWLVVDEIFEVEDRADRLEAMIDRMSETVVELRRQLFFASEETQKYRERVENLEKMITNKA